MRNNIHDAENCSAAPGYDVLPTVAISSGFRHRSAHLFVWVLMAATVCLACVPGDLSADDTPESRRLYLVGRRLQQELDKPVNIVRSRTTVRDIVFRIRELHSIALLVDRRIDPDQTIDVQFVQTTLGQGLELLASQLDAELVTVGGTLFIGPAESTDRIRTIIALRTREIRGGPSFGRLAELLQGTTVTWEDLAEPTGLLEDMQRTFRIEIANPDAIPHDLWGRGAMADVNAVEAVSLLLGQFDLTFQWQAEGESLHIIPAPESVVVAQSHDSRDMQADQAIALIQRTWPHLRPNRQGRSVTVEATAGEHDAIDELLNPPAEKPPSKSKTQGPLKNRLFTLTTTRAAAIAVLRTLELEGTTVEYDPQALTQAGIDLRQKLTLKLEKATADEFFTEICDPLGLEYELEGTTVRLTPK